MKRVTVLLADDHAIVREGVRNLLEAGGVCEVLGEASTGRQAVELARKLRPDVVVMDIAMPELNGFEATRQILLASPGVRVLVLSAHSDNDYIAHVVEVGAAGYVVKQSSGQALVYAIQEVAAGRRYFSPAIARRQRDAERKVRENGDALHEPRHALTTREIEVWQLVAEGAPNKQIAAALGISVKTVEKHRQQLKDKLDIHDTAGLTRQAIASGVIESSIQATTC
jgi:DNA-binding NarL/FixJ family response regulator